MNYCSVRKAVLRNFAKFTEKHLCQSVFFNKVAGLSPATLLKKKLWHRCFLVDFAKFLRTPFLWNTSGRLLLKKLSESFEENKNRPLSSPCCQVNPPCPWKKNLIGKKVAENLVSIENSNFIRGITVQK